METTLVFSIRYHNSRKGIRSATEKLGFKDLDKVDVDFLDIGLMPRQIEGAEKDKNWVEIIKGIIREGMDANDFKIVAVDSLEALYSLTDLEKPRRELFHLFGFLRELGATTFFISEGPPGYANPTSFGADFLADGIIFLKCFERMTRSSCAFR